MVLHRGVLWLEVKNHSLNFHNMNYLRLNQTNCIPYFRNDDIILVSTQRKIVFYVKLWKRWCRWIMKGGAELQPFRCYLMDRSGRFFRDWIRAHFGHLFSTKQFLWKQALHTVKREAIVSTVDHFCTIFVTTMVMSLFSPFVPNTVNIREKKAKISMFLWL